MPSAEPADLGAALLADLTRRPASEPAVLVAGDLNYDTIYQCPTLRGGREVLIRGFSRELAGAGGIVASGLARLGAEVHLFAEVGDDSDGRQLLEEIARKRIRAEGIRVRRGGLTPFTLIFTDEARSGQGEQRQVATFQGTSLDFAVKPGEVAPRLARCRLVYSCNYFILPQLSREVPALFRAARASGALTAYDANAGDGWEHPERLELLREAIYPETDLIFLNEEEAAWLTGSRDAEEAAALVRPASATVVVKRGPQGAVIRHRGRSFRVDAFEPPAAVRDTVGAGDSFQAAFAYFLLCGVSVERAAVLGAANAASTVSHTGGTAGQLDREGLAAFVAGARVVDEGGGVIRIGGEAGEDPRAGSQR